MNQNEALRRAVAQLPCCKCGIEGYSQAAHSNLYQHGKGRGLKANDSFIMALCAPNNGRVGCHVELDQLIGMTHEEAEVLTNQWIAQTYAALWMGGFLTIDLRKIPKP